MVNGKSSFIIIEIELFVYYFNFAEPRCNLLNYARIYYFHTYRDVLHAKEITCFHLIILNTTFLKKRDGFYGLHKRSKISRKMFKCFEATRKTFNLRQLFI